MKKKDIEKGVGISFVIILCLTALIVSQIGIAYASWSQFRHDLNNTGYTPEVGLEGGPKTNVIAWDFETGGAVTSSPAVVDGVVYVGSNDTYVYALNASTGKEIWRYQISGSFGWNGTYSSPAVVDGVVYIGSNDFNIYALNAATGDKIWNHTVYGYVYSSPAVVDDVVYVGGTDSFVYALDAATGHNIWNTSVGLYPGGMVHGITSSPAVVDGVVYIGSAANNTFTGNVTALDADTGNIIWMFPTTEVDPDAKGIWFSSPAVVDGAVYIGTWDGWVLALNATTQSLTHADRLLWNHKAQDKVATSPAVAYGMVYVGEYGFPAFVRALNASTGDPVWSKTGPTPSSFGVFCSPAVSDGVVYTGREDGCVLALDATTGGEIWHCNIGRPLRGSAVVAERKLFVGSSREPPAPHNSKVYCFGLGIWDINGDRVVDVVDLTIASLALWSTPGDPKWNPYADLNEDKIIDVVDLTIVSIHLWEAS